MFAELEQEMNNITKEAGQYQEENSEQDQKIINEVKAKAVELMVQVKHQLDQLTQVIRAPSDPSQYQSEAKKQMRRFSAAQLSLDTNRISHKRVVDCLERPEFTEDLDPPHLPVPTKSGKICAGNAQTNDSPVILVRTPNHPLKFEQVIEGQHSSPYLAHILQQLKLCKSSENLTGSYREPELELNRSLIMSIDQANSHHLYVLTRYGRRLAVSRINILTCDTEEIIQSKAPSEANNSFCVSTSYIITTICPNGLKFFNKEDGRLLRKIRTENLRGQNCKVAHLVDDTIIFSNPDLGEVSAMTLNRDDRHNLYLHWVQAGLDKPSALYINRSNNYILAAGLNGGHIYIISFKGDLLTTLKIPTDNAVSGISDISFNENRIFVTDGTKQIKVYQLEYKVV